MIEVPDLKLINKEYLDLKSGQIVYYYYPGLSRNNDRTCTFSCS